jgi:hypothetical protein
VYANEADLAQAVLSFQRAGVTHVTSAAFQADIPRFTDHAKQQGFKPRYGMPDEGILSISGGARRADPENFADALAVTLGREGEQRTAGMSPTAGTQKCDAYRKAAGLSTTWQQGATAGSACNQVWMLRDALGKAPNLDTRALQAGLQATKSLDFSFPHGPSDFTGPRVTTGGQFWRIAQFGRECACWRVVQRDFRRN